MTSRRRLMLVLLGAAALLLIAGRFAAHETAERLWALTTGAGGADLRLRRLALWSRAGWAALATGWFVTHLLVFLRAIGSVQFPRRLANLEIAEAVPRDLLVGGLVAAGIALGVVTTADTGGWWLTGSLAAANVQFGITDPHLGRDLGYYVAQLPWIDLLQRLAWRLVGLAVLLLAGLYTAIGAIRVRERRLFVSDGARRHLAVLGVAAAITVAWHTGTDAARVAAGLAGERALATIQQRLLASTLLPPLALVAATATATWAFSRKLLPTLAGWSLLAAAWFVVRIVLPAGSQATPTYPPELARLAFGFPRVETWPTALGSAQPDSVLAVAGGSVGIPVWDPDALAARYRASSDPPGRELTGLGLVAPARGETVARWRGAAVPAAGAAIRDAPSGPIARSGTGAAAGPIVEFDAATGTATRTTSATLWFAPGLTWFAVDRAEGTGIPLDRVGVRIALAWALQSAEVLNARGALIWRRSPEMRLERLAPFADFMDPRLVHDAAGEAVWVLDGYVTAKSFAGVPAVAWSAGDRVRYVSAGLIGTVRGSDGRAAIYVVPGADPVTQAWVRVATPLIRPADELPPALAGALAYPATLLRLHHTVLAGGGAVAGRGPAALAPARSATAIFSLPGDSGPRLWSALTLSGREGGSIRGLLAGTGAHGERHLLRLEFESDVSVPRWPVPGGDSLAGVLHVLPLGGALFTQQAVYTPEGGAHLALVRVTWGRWSGAGLTRAAALAELGPAGVARGEVPDVWGRMARAQALIRQADSLLTSGNFVGFAQAFEELKRVLAPPRPPR